MCIRDRYKIGPLFTPPVVSKAGGPFGTIISPGAQGGTNWPGGAYDPETHKVYVFSETVTGILGLVPPPDTKVSDMDYIQGRVGQGFRVVTPMGAAPARGGRGGRGGPDAPAFNPAGEGGGRGLS